MKSQSRSKTFNQRVENRVEQNAQNLKQKWEGKKAKKIRWLIQKVRFPHKKNSREGSRGD